MDDVAAGILHWTTYHEGIGQPVHSYLHVASGAIFDPRLPEGGVDALADATVPSVVLLSNRHHLRHGQQVADTYGIPIRCHEAGLHEFSGADAPDVEPFAFGDEVAPGIRALEVGVLCPEETAFHLAGEGAEAGAVLFADAIIRGDGQLGFVPDGLLGDDPEAIKRGIRGSVQRILDDAPPFDAVLLAHGEPIAAGGREQLAAFAAAG
jgi:hypothetical protein